MSKFFTALLEFLNKYGYNFITASFLSGVTIFVLYKTKYPYIFKLWEFQEGRIKVILFICTLIFLYLVLCQIAKTIKEKIDNSIKNKKINDNIIQHIHTMLKNPETYRNELCVLSMITRKGIQCFNIDTLLKLYKEINPDIVHLSRFRNLFQDAVYSLKNFKIVKVEGIGFYSIKDELFNAILEELNNGYSK